MRKPGTKAKRSWNKQTATKTAAVSTGVWGLGAGAATAAMPHIMNKKYPGSGSFMPKKTMAVYGAASVAYGGAALYKAHKMHTAGKADPNSSANSRNRTAKTKTMGRVRRKR